MTIDRGAVIEAAVGLVRGAGLEALGVRAVAAELGVTPMALYRHVDDAATLHAAVVERLLQALPRVPASGRWDERCRQWSRELRTGVLRCPGLARHLLTTWTELPPAVVMINDVATMIEAEGPPGIDAVAASNALFTYVLARVQAEEAVSEHGLVRRLEVWDDLGPEVPFLQRHREEYAVARIDEHFGYGLDALLAGLATARRRRRRARA